MTELCRNFRSYFLLLCAILCAPQACAADLVEFLNGSKVSGTIKSIRKADKEFDFETRIGKQSLTRSYPFSKVHAVTYNGKRYELTPKSDGDAPLTKSQVLSTIEAAGNKQPDWYESTPLKYPKTLDLSWPLKPPTKGWQSQKNMGQYIWSVINENPGRWNSGIKLIHHCISLHQDDKVLLERDMKALAQAYFRLKQDYARAAFWYQKARVNVQQLDGVRLAECYWRLGNREMALEMLKSQRLHFSAIKLFGDMGEIDKAVKLADAYSRGRGDYEANILAADALRLSGRLDEAIDCYERVLNSKTFRNEEYAKRFRARASESIETIRLFDQADISKVADGTYRDSSTGYNGPLTVEATVASGRLESVKVTKHREKQFYSSLTDTPNQLIEKQSVRGIDGTSSATITSQAIVNATAKALAQGTR